MFMYVRLCLCTALPLRLSPFARACSYQLPDVNGLVAVHMYVEFQSLMLRRAASFDAIGGMKHMIHMISWLKGKGDVGPDHSREVAEIALRVRVLECVGRVRYATEVSVDEASALCDELLSYPITASWELVYCVPYAVNVYIISGKFTCEQAALLLAELPPVTESRSLCS